MCIYVEERHTHIYRICIIHTPTYTHAYVKHNICREHAQLLNVQLGEFSECAHTRGASIRTMPPPGNLLCPLAVTVPGSSHCPDLKQLMLALPALTPLQQILGTEASVWLPSLCEIRPCCM